MTQASESFELAKNLITRVNIGDALTRTAARLPQQEAVVDGDRRWTYRELDAWVNRLANGLADRGYQRGDALALASGNSAEFLATYFACAKLGVVCVPMNLGWRVDEIAYVLDHSSARGVVVETQLAGQVLPAVEKVPAVTDVIIAPGLGVEWEATDIDRVFTTIEEVCAGAAGETAPERFVDERDAVSYLYTSGTTSFPKGVVGSHVAIYVESMMAALETQMTADDRMLAVMPMFHTAQLNAFTTPLVLVGATQVLHRSFDADAVLETLEREQITRAFLLPMMWRALVEHPDVARRDLSALRKAAYAMTPMPDSLLRQCLDTFGCDFFLAFGQTEYSPVTTFFRPEHQLSHSGAVGTQVVNVQVAIMDEAGNLLPAGQEGEIVYRGPHAFNGYLNNPEATEEAFRHGWFHSGDSGYLAEDGMLWFSDRYKDVIKSGGENVASIEVEKAVYAADPRVGEVAVIGLPHEHWVEAITAVVVPRPGEDVDEHVLMATLREQLAGFKSPKAVITLDELPKTSTGKIQKNVLRERLRDHYGS